MVDWNLHNVNQEKWRKKNKEKMPPTSTTNYRHMYANFMFNLRQGTQWYGMIIKPFNLRYEMKYFNQLIFHHPHNSINLKG